MTDIVKFEKGSVVSGFQAMGKLVIELALINENPLESETKTQTLPTTWGQLQDVAEKMGIELQGTGAGYNTPDGQEDYGVPLESDTVINVIPYPQVPVSITLPLAKQMEMTPEQASQDYPLPEFYSQDAFESATQKIQNPMSFLLKRIGEYTTQKCR